MKVGSHSSRCQCRHVFSVPDLPSEATLGVDPVGLGSEPAPSSPGISASSMDARGDPGYTRSRSRRACKSISVASRQSRGVGPRRASQAFAGSKRGCLGRHFGRQLVDRELPLGRCSCTSTCNASQTTGRLLKGASADWHAPCAFLPHPANGSTCPTDSRPSQCSRECMQLRYLVHANHIINRT